MEYVLAAIVWMDLTWTIKSMMPLLIKNSSIKCFQSNVYLMSNYPQNLMSWSYTMVKSTVHRLKFLIWFLWFITTTCICYQNTRPCVVQGLAFFKKKKIWRTWNLFMGPLWYPCFGLLVMSPLGFKARAMTITLWPEWAALFMLGRGIHVPEIHLWCDTCRPLGGQHSRRAVFHIPARHWWDSKIWSAYSRYFYLFHSLFFCRPLGRFPLNVENQLKSYNDLRPCMTLSRYLLWAFSSIRDQLCSPRFINVLNFKYNSLSNTIR